MTKTENSTKGYVYILEVADIDLPVCKIGMTRRIPIERCAEINKSSAGDFLWKVASEFAVDDCQKLESLVHRKLRPLRQKGREFFNLTPDDAHQALRSILDSQSEIREVADEDMFALKTGPTSTSSPKSKRRPTFRDGDSAYAEILQSFASKLGIKGTPFGQLNQPSFGMSDGNNGVQWNISLSRDTPEIWLGVNFEGMRYSNWPIADFVQRELESLSMDSLKADLCHMDRIFVHFARDAWMGKSRPPIIEHDLGCGKLSIARMNSTQWADILNEALGCLNEEKAFRGRSKQVVTFVTPPKNGSDQKRELGVSPHLNISTRIDTESGISAELEAGFNRLKPVHRWVSRQSAKWPPS